MNASADNQPNNPGIHWREVVTLAGIVLLALALRLLVWEWREFYPLGGDEQEYLNQALTLLRERRYEELRLMRPPLYGVFLAGCIYLFDSLVQNLRLVQAFISAATVVPVWLLTRAISERETGGIWSTPPLLAALLAALSYTLAMRATELLTETVFLFGLTVCFWLLVRASSPTQTRPGSAFAAGLVLGALCLTRSVAQVLLPLGALWLLLCVWQHRPRRGALLVPLLFVAGTLLLVLPWTVRNTLTYGSVILIDTTGAENLWLDNDPAGREAVKAQLYALGDDQATRQQLAAERGIAAIVEHPQHFARKAWGEMQAFFALEYADDMRQRQAIWVPPAEVWLRLLLGDALWLLVLLAGVAGLFERATVRAFVPWYRRPAVLPGLWALYTLLTTLIFHVELRYRLPLFPVLLPYAALLLCGEQQLRWRTGPLLALILLLLLLHRPYPLLAWQLGWKHWHLWQSEQALAVGNSEPGAESARAALAHDPDSALARVALARAAMQQDKPQQAQSYLNAAIEQVPAHPHAHLLRGDLLRQQGQPEAARRDLAYETAALQDLQRWSWQRFTTPPTTTLDVGGGLDLGLLAGFHPAETGDPDNPDNSGLDWRWTRGQAVLRLALPPPEAGCAQPPTVALRLAANRPAAAPPEHTPLPVAVLIEDGEGGQTETTLTVADGWNTYRLPLLSYTAQQRSIVVHLDSPTFRPRTFDPASPDGRRLGVLVDWARVVPGCP